MNAPPRQVGLLIGAAVAMAAALALVAGLTRDRIYQNERAWLQQRLDALVPPNQHDNDLLRDRIEVVSPDILGTREPVTIYRARRGAQPVAAIIRTVAPDGYQGPIELLVAVARDGKLLGVQVIHHRETPGLGDAFEHRNHDWLGHFAGRSLADPPLQRWTVRQDGGDFDAFTGATITPRAIVKATRRALEYYHAHQAQIFALPVRQ